MVDATRLSPASGAGVYQRDRRTLPHMRPHGGKSCCAAHGEGSCKRDTSLKAGWQQVGSTPARPLRMRWSSFSWSGRCADNIGAECHFGCSRSRFCRSCGLANLLRLHREPKWHARIPEPWPGPPRCSALRYALFYEGCRSRRRTTPAVTREGRLIIVKFVSKVLCKPFVEMGLRFPQTLCGHKVARSLTGERMPTCR